MKISGTILSKFSNKNEIKLYGGGKALSLYQLDQFGLRVPEWYCLDTRFFDFKIAPIKEQIKILLSTKDYAQIHQLIMGISFTEDEQDQLSALFPKQVAVRSSANAEDGVKSSFAGIFETYLFVKDDLVEKIKSCWASLFTIQHLDYLDSQDLDIFDLKMSVVIQEMINSDKSGIYFQAHPNGNIGKQLIVAGPGLGQGVVDGETPTDIITIDSITLKWDEEIQQKDSKLVYCSTENTIQNQSVNKEDSLLPCLNQSEISYLIEQSLKIKNEDSLFHDIEWTIKDGTIFFLQARPITTVSQNSEITFYDNSNIIENYPGITLPFTASNLKRLYGVNFESLLIRIGLDNKTLDHMNPIIYQLTETFHGRVYYQVNNWYKCLELIPFTSGLIKKSWDQMIGIKNLNSQKKFLGEEFQPNHFKIATRVLPSFFQAIVRVDQQKMKYQKHFEEFYSFYRQIDLTQYTKLELVELYQDAEVDFFGFTNMALFNDLSTSVLLSICKTLLNNDLDKLVSLTQNDHEIESYKLVVSTQNLVSYLKLDEKLMDIIRQTINEKQLKILQIYDHDFFELLETHFKLYGDRSMEEMKFEVPTTREEPFIFLQSILAMCEIPLKEESVSPSLKNVIGNPVKRILIKPILKRYKAALAFRELSRLNRARMKGLMRNFLLTLGQRLVEQGRILKKEDIFYLEENFLISNLRGIRPFHKSVQDAKESLKKYSDMTFPGQFILNSKEFDPDWYHDQPTSKQGENEYTGTGCHGGDIFGEILIVEKPSLDLDVTDKILVTKTTDPGWVFLMMRAKAIIVERGNLLSHAAIIGREIGIPTIIGIPGICSSLKSGDMVLMNGKSGVIKKAPLEGA